FLTFFWDCRFSTVKELDTDGFGGNPNHVDVGYIGTLYYTTTPSGASESKPSIRNNNCAIENMHMLNYSRHYVADYLAAVSMINDIVLHDHIFRRNPSSSAIFIFPRFKANGIVSYIKVIIVYHHILA